jgi:hypothetical protein
MPEPKDGNCGIVRNDHVPTFKGDVFVEEEQVSVVEHIFGCSRIHTKVKHRVGGSS